MGEAPVTMLLPSPAQGCAHRVLCCWGRQHVTPPGVSGCEEVFATRMQTSLLTGEAGKQQKKEDCGVALFPHGTAQTEKGAMPIWLPAPVPPSPAAAQHRCTRHFGARRELHTTALLLEVQGEGMTPSPLPRSRSWGALAATPRPIRPGHRRAEQKPTGRAVRFPAAPSPAHPPLQSRALSHGRSMSNHLKPRCRTSRFPRCPL